MMTYDMQNDIDNDMTTFMGKSISSVKSNARMIIISLLILWILIPISAHYLAQIMPRDPMEPSKITFGAAAIVGLYCMIGCLFTGVGTLIVAGMSWSNIGVGYRISALVPAIGMIVFWFYLVLVEGM